MIAYCIHWKYPSSADNELFFGGRIDDKLFHKEENAINYAKEQLKKWQDDENRFYELDMKDNDEGLSPEEKEEWAKLAATCCGDFPCDYNVCKGEIKFEDEDNN